jgi:pimeloyl-ACP methyl ester carboxylesterase
LLWVVVWLACLCGPVFAAGTEFIRAPGFAYAGPAVAKGVLVWIPGTYGRDQTGPPPPPDFVSREAAAAMDVWCLNRDRNDDPLGRGGEILAREVQGLRELGYRRVIVAGHSRGAWIALTALAHPGLADAVVAFSPAAHGTHEGHMRARPEWFGAWDAAMTDWTALWDVAVNNGTRVVLVQLADDPYDPDPARRLAIARDRLGDNLLSIFQPPEPKGHAGVYEPAFDLLFGAGIAAFIR